MTTFVLLFISLTHLMFFCTGLADSYVKSCLGPFKFQTQIEENTIP